MNLTVPALHKIQAVTSETLKRISQPEPQRQTGHSTINFGTFTITNADDSEALRPQHCFSFRKARRHNNMIVIPYHICRSFFTCRHQQSLIALKTALGCQTLSAKNTLVSNQTAIGFEMQNVRRRLQNPHRVAMAVENLP